MKVDIFDFDLPESSIALRPVEPRDAARMLHVSPANGGVFADRIVRELPAMLRAGDVLVMNDTRVIPARLHGVRKRGEAAARIEILLHQRLAPERWKAFARPAKKLVQGETVRFGGSDGAMAGQMQGFDATVLAKGEGGEVELEFALSGPALDEAIARHGELPLPPYIAGKRATDARDTLDYQTTYAREDGAVAAPTAGLHITPELLERIRARGVTTEFVTLHVGAGTFLPVKADDTQDHKMHAEWGHVSADAADRLNAARRAGGRIVAVGTTSLRLLESAADEAGVFHAFAAATDIFITPGYRFRGPDLLMTNFHLPRSTLFMLVSAFCGLEVMKTAYMQAIARGYRFYSYGDASLLERA
ncbi:MAG: tRNA preQ1(34) S-adenosylmethionine ribosyltransferase-isomerase QueA [Bosea sp. (in: a-proteobacteria)]